MGIDLLEGMNEVFYRLATILLVRTLLKQNVMTAQRVKKKLKFNCLKCLKHSKKKQKNQNKEFLKESFWRWKVIFPFQNELSIVNSANFPENSAELLWILSQLGKWR